MIVNEQMVDAVHRNACSQRVLVSRIYIMIRNGKQLLVFGIPDVRQRPVNRCADGDCVSEHMRLMNTQTQAVQTVATVDTWRQVTVLAGRPEGVDNCSVFAGLRVEDPRVLP